MPDIFNPYNTITTPRDARELAAMLLHPERERPAVVVSTTKNGPVINPKALADRLGNDVDVYLINSASLAYDFSDAMPLETSVYGGAARCYPPGTAWVKNPFKSMLRLAYTEEEGQAAIVRIVDDVAAMESLVPLKVTSTSPRKQPSTATVDGIVSVILEPDGVLIKLEDGIARIDTSVLAPGISPDRLFSPSQKVTGTVRDGLFTITEGLNTPADAADHAARGTIQPALVLSSKTIALFPGLTVRHASEAKPGTVIAVRVEIPGRADGKAWKLITVTDPDEVTDALPFLAGGEPWIRWDTDASTVEVAPTVNEAPAEPDDVAPAPAATHQEAPVTDFTGGDAFAALDAVRARLEHLSAENERLSSDLEDLLVESVDEEAAIPVPSPALGGAEVGRLRAQVALMTRERVDMLKDHRRAMADADDLAAENARMAHTIERLRDDVRKERARADRARQMSRDIDDVADTAPLFNDPAEQFRHEVYLEWATRIPAGAKAETPLAEYGFADGFLTAAEEIQGVDRSKIVAVAMEVLTGLADSLPGRDMHRLRGGLPGTSSCVEDPELGTAWRVALQVKTASARRMHFWRGTDGKIVFATVGLHDDMSI
ncbi:hypothetical protein [Arthrobacter methylotrophus]|uniref:Uncharacterized protein n=2 Tax=Arthrobacter methylotrophus TaxID=121291 RepID=A0ABV5UP71_9MICC